tara:strand:+ start:8017 stop:9141 length:1125 start_codon:yes stop_codon:yes gene_type:complete
MKKIGITGSSGFIGSHLVNHLLFIRDDFKIIDFKKIFFNSDNLLDSFVSKCDIIVHLAGVNKSEDPKDIYKQNILLAKKLTGSLKRTKSSALIIYASSTQEKFDNEYGRGKKDGRKILETWAESSNGFLTSILIPNVFGPFCKPNYNSVIATFCNQLVNKKDPPLIIKDSLVNFIYVDDLIQVLLDSTNYKNKNNSVQNIENTYNFKVSEVLSILKKYHSLYVLNGKIPELDSNFELKLFNTFRSYINYQEFFPKKYLMHSDERGIFTELIRSDSKGQCSFSVTKPFITRGNHFHTRKIERFSVIKGEARIEIRKINDDKVLTFILSEKELSYVDIPIWHSHSITNIGSSDLLTVFWINEEYHLDTADTYINQV